MTEEPVLKRARMADIETIDNFIDNIVTSKKNLQAVLSDEFYNPMPSIKMYVGQVKDVKEMSKIISILNERIQLKELSHLKRARKKDVILCPIHFLNALTEESIQEYIIQNISELKDSFEYFKILDVPAQPPKLKKQHIESIKNWSCNFHPNKYLEELSSGNFFNEHDIREHRQYMGMTFEVAKWHLSKTNSNLELSDIILSDMNASVVVDPLIGSVVAVAFDNRKNHPVQHSAMLAIDNVAKTQNGGAWDVPDVENVTLRGFNEELLLHLRSAYPSLKFGARKYLNKNDLSEYSLNANNYPYLCTGYYVYLIREPCVMCAMGLVHARARRVFFCFKNSFQGALCSKTKLQCVTSLNHHFEVFTEFL